MTNIVFIKGAKQSVVDFINRGLKGCKSNVRVSADMSGGQIADRLIEPGCPISMHSYLPMAATSLHAEFENAPMYFWICKYETPEKLCLSLQLLDATMYPVAFLRFINGLDGITVYAYGFEYPFYQSWYQYNGRTDEVIEKDVLTDPKFEQYKEALKQQADYNPKTVDAEASYKVLEGYLQDFQKELNKEIMP